MINDLSVKCSTLKFIDDTTTYFSNKKAESQSNSMQKWLKEVLEGTESNDVKLNSMKTNLMVIQFEQEWAKLSLIRVNSEIVECVGSARMTDHNKQALMWPTEVSHGSQGTKIHMLIDLRRSDAIQYYQTQ